MSRRITDNSKIVPRLRELAKAIASGDKSELTMRVPAQVNRDADIVLSAAADRIERLEDSLRADQNNWSNEVLEITGELEAEKSKVAELEEEVKEKVEWYLELDQMNVRLQNFKQAVAGLPDNWRKKDADGDYIFNSDDCANDVEALLEKSK